MDVDQIIGSVRTLLNDPEAQRPHDGQIMLALRKSVQMLANEMQLAPPAWSLESAPVTTDSSGRDVPFTQFVGGGKIRRVYCQDTNPEYPNAEIGPGLHITTVDQLGQWGGLGAWAQAVAPFYDNTAGGWKLRFAPTPTETRRYTVWWETGEMSFFGRTGQVLPQAAPYHYLLCDMTALQVLPYCWWGKLLPAENPNALPYADQLKVMTIYRSELRSMLQTTAAEYRRQFADYILSTHQSSQPNPNPYGGWGDFDDSVGW